jgi:hypothetical protein
MVPLTLATEAKKVNHSRNRVERIFIQKWQKAVSPADLDAPSVLKGGMPVALNESKRPPLARSLEFSAGWGTSPTQSLTRRKPRTRTRTKNPRKTRRKTAQAVQNRREKLKKQTKKSASALPAQRAGNKEVHNERS